MAKDTKDTRISFVKAVNAVGSGKTYQAMSLVKDNPDIAAAVSKLVPAVIKPTYDSKGNREIVGPNFTALKGISDRTAQSINDAETVMDLFPDMELSSQMLISLILSPKDMMNTDLTYSVTQGLIAPDVTAAMIERTSKCFDVDYKIKPLLQKILKAVLFTRGSWISAILPENSLDHIINGSVNVTMESLSESINSDGSIKPLGLLGPYIKELPNKQRTHPGLSLESFNNLVDVKQINSKVTLEGLIDSKTVPTFDTFLTVTDNFDVLKVPEIQQKQRERRVIDKIGSKTMTSIQTAMEAYSESIVGKNAIHKLNDREMTGLLYQDRGFQYKPIIAIRTQDQLNRRTVGNPLVMELPSEAVLPVFIPGKVERQVGCFVMIDADGNPLEKANKLDYYQQLSSQLNTNGSFPSAMLTRVKSQYQGFEMNNRQQLDYVARSYGELVEQELLGRLRNGEYGGGLRIAKNEDIYMIMLGRMLQKQHTQLLFIPAELYTYFAFRYNSDGIGVSLLEGMKILNSLRAMLLFGNVMASLKNSIGRTEVKIKLDPEDPNPQKTIEVAMHEIVRSRQHYFPLGMSSPTDLVDWLQKAGFEFTYEGHPSIPDVGIDFGEKASNYIKPDSDLEESLRKRSIMAVGLSPATVDASFEAEFATSVVTNNLLTSKRVMQIQEMFIPLLNDHMRKYMINSERLTEDLKAILRKNYEKLKPETLEHVRDINNEPIAIGDPENELNKEHIITLFFNEFIQNFSANLPKPNSVTLENQVAAMDIQSKALDLGIDQYLSDKFLTSDLGGDVSVAVVAVKEALKTYFMRKWMNENGVMPELAALTTSNEEGNPELNLFDINAAHISALTKSIAGFMQNINQAKQQSNATIQAIGGDLQGGGGGGSSDSSGGDNSFGGGSFGLDSGGGSEGGSDEGFGSGDFGGAGDMFSGSSGEGTDTENETTETGEESSNETPGSPDPFTEPNQGSEEKKIKEVTDEEAAEEKEEKAKEEEEKNAAKKVDDEHED